MNNGHFTSRTQIRGKMSPLNFGGSMTFFLKAKCQNRNNF